MTLKDILEERNTNISASYLSSYDRIDSIAKEEWLPTVEPINDTFNSLPHLENIIHIINEMIPTEMMKTLSSAEIYILLCSILLHDIGKAYLKKSDKSKLNKIHPIRSCKIISNNYERLGIINEDFAKYIAIVVCSHGWDKPHDGAVLPLNEMQQQNNIECGRCNDNCGLCVIYKPKREKIHLHRIAALLRIGDELENGYQRVVPDWLKEFDNKDTTSNCGEARLGFNRSTSWRQYVYDVEFDAIGNSIKLISDIKFEKYIDWINHPNDDENKIVSSALDSVDKISKLLINWKAHLHEIGIYYDDALLELGQPYHILAKKVKDTENPFFVSESGLSPYTLEQIADLSIRMHKGIAGINIRPFKWMELASAIGIDNVDIVKKYIYRLQSFSNIYASLKGSAESTQPHIVQDITKGLNDRILNIFSYDVKCTNESWLLKERNYAIPFNENTKLDRRGQNYILTGLGELDYLLCPEINVELDEEEKLPINNAKPPESSDETELTDSPPKKNKGFGLYIPSEGKSRKSPIVVVEGSSGDGKTILLNQIACNLSVTRANLKSHICVYFSFEQEAERVINSIKGFNFFDLPRQLNGDTKDFLKIMSNNLFMALSIDGWHNCFDKLKCNTENDLGKIIFPLVTPIVADNHSNNNQSNYEQRFNDIKKCLLYIWKRHSERMVCFIDSLNALTSTPLTREQATSLFSFFRRYEIPLIASLERQKHWGHATEITHYNISRYLADVEIKLMSENINNYFRQYLEVKKTRFNRRILGRHQFKIKSSNQSRTGKYDPRIGIVIYPSLHAVLSRSNDVSADKRFEIKKDIGNDITIINESGDVLNVKGIIDDSVLNIYSGNDDDNNKCLFADNTCFVISGPHGGHKFALAVNLLLNHTPYSENKLNQIPMKIYNDKNKRNYLLKNECIKSKKLIISFAEEGKIKLDQIALLPELGGKGGWRDKLQPLKLLNSDKKSSILTENHYGITDNDNYICPVLTVLNVSMGHILPEEILYIINRYLKDNDELDSILFDNTAHIRNRFPSLNKEPLFTAAIVDIIKKCGCYSVFVDVCQDENNPDDHSKALLSMADCRILIKKDPISRENMVHTQNVIGKDYRLTPHIIFASDTGSAEPKLIIKQEKNNATHYRRIRAIVRQQIRRIKF